ncbi:pas domain s-box [Halogeometricum borinquense DSM 11551]|uniref:PAS domain S-box n=1 Tax=Halogeometricum borinquense (strain ATCC 700274 / DSM 11551 / JCM 10706 / KCTC 4070 / PR3) TaxID=469382 RepID=E4NPF9_HALBP|nr:GAF domain-containing protein [Halogeometricum borinquense]ADQ66514.1 PAS domain S-box [Halogeometricum borinquense DSM 11551]ELY30989.1 pas domain s-box [Halogeometricum borinquense DSM 11551]
MTAEFSVAAENPVDMDATPEAATPPQVLFVGGPEWADSAVEELRSVASVQRVESVADGCERLSSGHPDAVVVARSEDGVTAVSTLRADAADLPIVFCTDIGSESVARDVLAAGATDYVPFDTPDFGSYVRERTVEAAAEAAERVELERELRASEELHRVTLNNMTDTVLITDDEGKFTYVCPNVHFIFGYTEAEIRDLGSIDALLGDDLFEESELEKSGVLTNVECTATDKAGEEHTLLVNVREVSIQGGTTLYSCRDVTKRKQREESLTGLHRTTSELQYAETVQEIAHRVVDDADEILGCAASAVFRFDAETNRLEPVAHTPAMDRLYGPLPSFRPSEGNLIGRAFVTGEPLFFDDVHESPALSNPATDLRSVVVLSLGDHGVLVAGVDTVGAFDEVHSEIADLLATTAEAALDRVKRQSQLREQDRELQRRNERLVSLNRVNEIIREVDQSLIRAETREAVERAVCERLTAEDRYEFAWVGSIDPTSQTLVPRAASGTGRGYLDDRSLALDPEGEPACSTAATDEETLVSNVATDLQQQPWRRAALERDFQSVVAVPLSYDGVAYGVLTVYADRPAAFDGMVRTVMAELGETVASAISAVERKAALLTTAVTRVEYAVAGGSFPLARVAERADCTLSVVTGIQQTVEDDALFATVEGASMDAVRAAAADTAGIAEYRVVAGDDAAGTVWFRFVRPVIASRLANHGVVLRRAEATPTETLLEIDIPDGVELHSITQLLSGTFDAVELRSKRHREQPSGGEFTAAVLDRLTERQLEVVQTAYYAGYFENPRAHSGDEVADVLGVSPAAFYRHIRTVQRKLFAVLFEETEYSASIARDY